MIAGCRIRTGGLCDCQEEGPRTQEVSVLSSVASHRYGFLISPIQLETFEKMETYEYTD